MHAYVCYRMFSHDMINVIIGYIFNRLITKQREGIDDEKDIN